MLLILPLASSCRTKLPSDVFFRFGEPKDTLAITSKLLAAKMNPLGIQHERFIVCESAAGERVAFGQLKVLAKSRAADARIFDAPPGSVSFEAEADDEAWDDLEREGIPLGLNTLPWAPGYRALQQRAEMQRARRRARIEQASADAMPLLELSSVYVEEAWRGRGVGSALVRRLMKRHAQRGGNGRDVFLLTLDSTRSWYERLGFEVVSPEQVIPRQLAVEVAAGGALSALLGNRLICMRGTAGGRTE